MSRTPTAPSKTLANLIHHMKFGKYLSDKKRREIFSETVHRNMTMHLDRFPALSDEIVEAFSFVEVKKVLPSMRGMQFAGIAIDKNAARMYNCSYCHISSPDVFKEVMFLLLSGCGVGYSIQKHHVASLPKITKPVGTYNYVIRDSIEGWADAVGVLVNAYFLGSNAPQFVYDKVRPSGSPIVTSGGVAPGPEPLRRALDSFRALLDTKRDGERLSPLNCHDLLCFLANAVLAGGVRRSSYIALFSEDDEQMLTCKSGEWWENSPQRALANNSMVVLRRNLTRTKFEDLWCYLRESGSGEPNIFQTNDLEWGTNPCFGPEEKLLTPAGYETFVNLAKRGDVTIVNADGRIVPSQVWCSGKKTTVQVKNTNGDMFTCTPDHRWKTTTGDVVEAKDLKGHRLKPYLVSRKPFDSLFDPLYVKLGFIQGDGNLGRLKSKSHKQLEVNIGQKDGEILTLFGVEREKPDQRKFYLPYKEKCQELGFSNEPLPNRVLPTTFNRWELAKRTAFLRGLFSANGCVIRGCRVAFKTTCADLILQIKEMLDGFEIDCYITTNKPTDVEFENGTYKCRESYDLNITRFKSLVSFQRDIGFVHEYKTRALYDLILQKSPKIISVKPGEEVDVYDFTEPETNWGCVQAARCNDDSHGFVAHNCGEIAIKDRGLCNLVEINAATVSSLKDLTQRAVMAARIATLQATYTDFHFLHNSWKQNAEEDALIGVSMTGIAAGKVMELDLQKAARAAREENRRIATKIGIRPAKRVTTVKPAGTTSLELGNGSPISSGVHAYHAHHWIRRVIVTHTEPVFRFLKENYPWMIESSAYRPETESVISIPLKAPQGAIMRTEGAISLLRRVQDLYHRWVLPGHREGENTNNVSCTINVKPHEWDEVADWWWMNRDSFVSVTMLPYDGGTYKQLPMEECSEETYIRMASRIEDIDFSKVREGRDNTTRAMAVACSGGVCELV